MQKSERDKAKRKIFMHRVENKRSLQKEYFAIDAIVNCRKKNLKQVKQIGFI